MNFQLSKKINNYHMANEVLYALDAVEKTTIGHLSRLTLQKMLYLSGVLAPIKNIVLEYLRFSAEQLGPYKGEIQETVDHLVGTGLANVLYFKKTQKGALTHYVITDTGKEVVARLNIYPQEEEKYWWISLVTKLAHTYQDAYGLQGDIDKRIRKIVYQDPTYKDLNSLNARGQLIDLSDAKGMSYVMSNFIKKYLQVNNLLPFEDNVRRNVELIVVSFFEYYYVNYLDENKVK